MEDRILQTINKYNLIEFGDKIVLGVSGGPDSVCMLMVLNKLKEKLGFDIVVGHVNHGLRENAKLDEKYVLELTQKLGIKCFVCHANIEEEAKKQKRGIEETGRIIRYNFFEEILKQENANKIAIAHNSNDNVETIIMNIMRGSGTSGLKGIEPKNGIYIRPLIEIKRDDIEEYTKEFHPRHDESNDENEYTRNKIRNIVIPYIKSEFNPNILDTITRLSSISKEEGEYLELKTKEAYQRMLIEENEQIILDLKKFNSEELVIRKRIILYSINRLFGSTKGIEKIHIDDIIKLCSNNIGNKYLTPNKNTKIVIKNKQINIISVKC
ncbi:MAG: tRNA lysidine(34) synthetase TilS [Clostridia bacterium]|nr:tRNA lysidine(34) synthetase TilS [Clostridia bacterium]